MLPTWNTTDTCNINTNTNTGMVQHYCRLQCSKIEPAGNINIYTLHLALAWYQYPGASYSVERFFRADLGAGLLVTRVCLGHGGCFGFYVACWKAGTTIGLDRLVNIFGYTCIFIVRRKTR